MTNDHVDAALRQADQRYKEEAARYYKRVQARRVRIAIGFVLLLVLSGYGLAAGCGENYSVGDRAGVVTKFSHKGLFIKSWEGELVMGGFRRTENGAVANVFPFSVDCQDQNLCSAITRAVDNGTPVVLHYRQWFHSPMRYGADSIVTTIKPVEDTP